MKKSNKMITSKDEKVMHKFSFPEHKVSVEAESLKEAEKKLEKITSKK